MNDYSWVEVLLGMLFVVVYSFERFNTPNTNRSSTTAFRYYSGAGAYALFAMGLYLVLTRFQELVRVAFAGADPPEYLASMKSPFVAALVVTVLLPAAPWLNTLDQRVRAVLHRFSSIPTEALRLSHMLRQAPFEVPPPLHERVSEGMLAHGFVETDSGNDEAHDIAARARMLIALMERLEDLKSTPRFSPFLLQSESHVARQQVQQRVLEQLGRCLSMLREPDAGADARGSAALSAWLRGLDEQLKGQVKETCDFISRMVLLTGRTHAVRTTDLASFGFKLDEIPLRLTWDQTVLMFVSLTGISLLAHLYAHLALSGEANFLELLVRSAVVSVAATLAVLCATVPKTLWLFGQRKPSHARPWTYYVIATAAAPGLVAGLGFVVLLLAKLDFNSAYASFMQYTSWLILAATVAGVTAFQTDSVPGPTLSPRQWRLVEGAVQAIALCGAALLALWDFSARMLTTPNAYALVAGAVVAGFVVGACIPTWYRNVPDQLRAPQPRAGIEMVGRAAG